MANETKIDKLEQLVRLIRYYILVSTTQVGPGCLTSALSSTDLMTGLLFGGVFKFDVNDPDHPNNDRLIYSNRHASPLFYSLWAAAGKLEEKDIMTHRHFGSPFEGLPTANSRSTEARIGSLGKGLVVGVAMAQNAKLAKLPYKTYVLLNNSEMAEGGQWESIQVAANCKLDNLIGVLDTNRPGQRGQTMCRHDLHAYEKLLSAFGWETIVIDGLSLTEVVAAYEKAINIPDKPTVIIAKTFKGKDTPPVENQDGWYDKALYKGMVEKIIQDWGEIDTSIRGKITRPDDLRPIRQVPLDIIAPNCSD